ncbi:MAG: response regulator [Gammaproteobacteria bacterium]|nr:response regulator [Gammaproteobacteria bacterium]
MLSNKVLVVDDSPTDLKRLTTIISDAGCTVVCAGSGREALEKAKTERPDVIFLDIIMPDMDGFEACRSLTGDSQTKNIPVIFVTSKNQKADRVWAKMQGGQALVAKPYEAEEILDQLQAI